ncbi:MAG: phosphoribosyl-AMP cyclohydrolase [Kineosporiaceae bacterium]
MPASSQGPAGPAEAGGGVLVTADPATRPYAVRWNDDGLVPVVVQEHADRQVLMLAWADAAALAETLDSGWATYFSRSRGGRWRKGETSGHVQRVVRVSVDCDGDTVLYEVEQTGPACHTGTTTCFTDRTLPMTAAATAAAADR